MAMSPENLRSASAVIAVIAGALLSAMTATADAASTPAATAATFVDESGCGDCHEAEARAWTGSQHDLAMQEASKRTVLGDFDDRRFTHDGVTSRFFRRDGKFFVNTDGPDGELADFEVKAAFGVAPLQQYLVELPGGRLQALTIAWDTVKKRWFHLYPDEHIDHDDELHWTKRLLNWNHMCGECHATGYRKGYDAATNTYHTTAARFDVGCQGCHGPASRHAEWVKRVGAEEAKRSDERRTADFDVDLSAADARVQVETCARCHSRRGTESADYRYGEPLLDTHVPALLSEHLYYADGQIQDEVYVYGSFLQSKMYSKGVRCSDCHQPHSAKLRASGDALCISCHNPFAAAARPHVDGSTMKHEDFALPAHHHHEPGKPGSHCVDCHAPARTYMVVDPRRDHSFRIPRPDLSVAIGTPNACTGCHTEKSAEWAAEAVAKWYGPGRRRETHYGVALDAGRLGKPGAVEGLVALTQDASRPAIVRATALDLLARYPGASTVRALVRGLHDPDPLVRWASAAGCDLLPATSRIDALVPVLSDPVRGVRVEAARQLAADAPSLSSQQRNGLEPVLAEYEARQRENADQPEALVNLGNLYRERGDGERAEASYREAITRAPEFVPAYVNLADLYRTLGRDAEAQRALRDGLSAVPGDATLHGALGLALVRKGTKDEALAEFEAAAAAAPDVSRHAYVYAVALHDAGRAREAISVLEDAARRRGDREVLLALAAFDGEAGDRAGAEDALRKLIAINPDDPAVAGLVLAR